MNEIIETIARLAGVEPGYTDFYGNVCELPIDAQAAVLGAIGYDTGSLAAAKQTLEQLERERAQIQPVYAVRAGRTARETLRECSVPESVTLISEFGRELAADRELEAGYYAFESGGTQSIIVAAPPHSYVPPALEREKLWGIAAQLYALRSRRDWGIGDFETLRALVRVTREAGGAAVALNPLHELNLTNPTSASPYSPVSRFFLNVLYIDVRAAGGSLQLPLDGELIPEDRIAALRRAELVDYAGAAQVKLRALHALHESFEHFAGDGARSEFEAFREAGGARLRQFAIYEALMAHFSERISPMYGWTHWPAPYHDAKGAAVAEFARENARAVAFYEFAQWIADVQLAAAARDASGMGVGIYRDLAVGADANSADVWADRTAYCLGLSVGAPPDPLNASGQDWSLPPLNPRELRRRAYGPYIDLLRANMRHAGALRIDHAMSLMRLFCIPRGGPAASGTYVNYRLDELTAVLALESLRNRCMIVGEDLGTVPPGFRDHMDANAIFGCRLLYFERETGGRFRAPERYDVRAVASTGTHDLPPLAGFWANADEATRRELLEMLQAYGDLGTSNDVTPLALALASYRALGRSAAALLLLQIEDAVLRRDPVNTPGTFDEVPNWRRKIPVPIEELQNDRRFGALAAVLRESRSEGAA